MKDEMREQISVLADVLVMLKTELEQRDIEDIDSIQQGLTALAYSLSLYRKELRARMKDKMLNDLAREVSL